MLRPSGQRTDIRARRHCNFCHAFEYFGDTLSKVIIVRAEDNKLCKWYDENVEERSRQLDRVLWEKLEESNQRPHEVLEIALPKFPIGLLDVHSIGFAMWEASNITVVVWLSGFHFIWCCLPCARTCQAI